VRAFTVTRLSKEQQGKAMIDHPKPPFPKQHQSPPGITSLMKPVPDHGESSYKGSGRLLGRKAIITGGDSGIGRAVAIAFGREGADVLVSYLNEHEDAESTKATLEKDGAKLFSSLVMFRMQTIVATSSTRRLRRLARSIFS
jgi:short chain dehydrogenase